MGGGWYQGTSNASESYRRANIRTLGSSLRGGARTTASKGLRKGERIKFAPNDLNSNA